MSRIVRLVGLLLVVAFVVGVSKLERRRIEGSAVQPAGTSGPPRVDAARMVEDLQALSSPSFEGRLPGTPGSHRAQELILRRFRDLGLKPVHGSYEQKFSFTHHSIKALVSPSRPFRRDFSDATNLIGVVEGTAEPSRFTALTAHYDHLGIRDGQLYPGADDNASGVSAMLAAADYFSKHRPRRSILVIAFDGEEEGLQGSKYFMAHSPVDLRHILLDVNLDMIGRGDRNELYVAGTSITPALRDPVAAAARGRSIRVLFGHDRPVYAAGTVESWLNSSDHGPFNDAGIPFLYFGVEDHDDVHQPTDTADKIPRAFFVEAANLVVDVLAALDGFPLAADRDPTP